MNVFDHKDLGNHLLQLCPKVVYTVDITFVYYKITSKKMALSIEGGEFYCKAQKSLGLQN